MTISPDLGKRAVSISSLSGGQKTKKNSTIPDPLLCGVAIVQSIETVWRRPSLSLNFTRLFSREEVPDHPSLLDRLSPDVVQLGDPPVEVALGRPIAGVRITIGVSGGGGVACSAALSPENDDDVMYA